MPSSSPSTLSYYFKFGLLSVLLVLALIFTLPFYVFQSVLNRTGRLWNSNLRGILSTNRFFDSSDTLPAAFNISLSARVEGTISVADLVPIITKNWIEAIRPSDGELKYPELQAEIVQWMGYPFWKQIKHFDLTKYILKVEDSRGNELDEDGIFEMEKTILQYPFKQGCGSPWRIFLLPSSTGFTRIIFLFHHSLGDGRSLFTLLTDACTGFIPTRSVSNSLSQCTPSPRTLMETVDRVFSNNPFQVESKDMTNDRIILISSLLSTRIIKMLAEKLNVSFTIILSTAISGSLRRIFTNLDEPLPPSLYYFYPVPSRSPPEGLTNSLNIAAVALPINGKDWKERLNSCKTCFLEGITSGTASLIRLVNSIRNLIPLRWLNPYEGHRTCIIFTSFPGPKSPLYLNNQEITDLHFVFSGSKLLSVVIATLTYCDGLRFTVSLDRGVCEWVGEGEMKKIVQYFEEEIRAMIEATK